MDAYLHRNLVMNDTDALHRNALESICIGHTGCVTCCLGPLDATTSTLQGSLFGSAGETLSATACELHERPKPESSAILCAEQASPRLQIWPGLGVPPSAPSPATIPFKKHT